MPKYFILLLAFWGTVAGCDAQNPQDNPKMDQLQFSGCNDVREGNQTLLFTESALNAFTNEDVLYVFTQDGICVGQSGPFAGKNFAVAAWGDDSQTEEKDGLAPGEAFMLVLNAPRLAAPVELVPEKVEGPVTYVQDGITTIRDLKRE
ncbi:MAG TPA: hypothetical protein VFG50_06825 [Rhodothermales bacterium]|nr:hypothetical protein [Rhodothermales bacterium]